MAGPALQRYLAHRRRWEIGAWAALFVFNTVANIAVVAMDNARSGSGVGLAQIVTWETSSALLFAVLLPVLLLFDRRFPLTPATLPRNLLAHLAFTVPWSLAHVAGMVAIRKAVYAAAGGSYDFGPLPAEFFYEYLKDFRSYATFIATIYLYRFVLLRLQGEARFLAEGEAEDDEQPAGQGEPQPPPERFLVKKLGREFLVRTEDIEWVEAAGNYVNLHVGGRLYPLRATMKHIEQRLDGSGFARVHRSAIVNLDRLEEIEPFGTGDARARMRSGAQVPVSRRYRSTLREGAG